MVLMNARILFLGLMLAATVPVPVQAAETHTAHAIMLHDGWIRAAPPTAPVRAGYVMVMNHGDAAVVINQVRSEAFERIEIHTMDDDDDGVMRMRPLERLELAPFASIALKPGGMHLMLFGPQPGFDEAGSAELVFLHDDEELARARFPVKADADTAPEHDAMHEHHH